MGTAGNPNTLRRDLLVGFQCAAFAALIGSLCCAAMPLWSRLCRAGGLGGSAEVAGVLPHAPRLASVRFDRELAAHLEFPPPRIRVAANFKQVVTVSFRVVGAAGRIGAAEAGCSVGAPGLCFEKIDCLYLAPQTIRPGVVLCIDPNRADDPGQDGVSTMTLLHTFYPAGARPPVGARLTGRT